MKRFLYLFFFLSVFLFVKPVFAISLDNTSFYQSVNTNTAYTGTATCSVGYSPIFLWVLNENEYFFSAYDLQIGDKHITRGSYGYPTFSSDDFQLLSQNFRSLPDTLFADRKNYLMVHPKTLIDDGSSFTVNLSVTGTYPENNNFYIYCFSGVDWVHSTVQSVNGSVINDYNSDATFIFTPTAPNPSLFKLAISNSGTVNDFYTTWNSNTQTDLLRSLPHRVGLQYIDTTFGLSAQSVYFRATHSNSCGGCSSGQQQSIFLNTILYPSSTPVPDDPLASYTAVFVQPPTRYPFTDYVKIKPNASWQFIAGYTVPPSEYETAKIKVTKFTDNTFNNSTKTVIYDDYANIIDPNHDNTFPIVQGVSDTDTGCFVVQIKRPSGVFVNPPSGVLCYIGDSINGVDFTHYDFDGGLYFDQSMLGRIVYGLRQKVPLYYLYQVKNQISTISPTSSISLDQTFSTTIDGQKVSFPIVKFSDTTLAPFLSIVRVISTWLFYIILIVYLTFRIKDITIT